MGRVIKIFDGRAGAPVREDRFIPLIDLIRSWDQLDQPFLVPARYTPDKQAAAEMMRLLYLSARYYCSCGVRHCVREGSTVAGCPRGGQRISCKADVVKDGKGGWRTQFRFRDKRDGQRYMIEHYGPDRSKWPYDPYAKRASA